jgi:hypothetical protein
MKIVFERKTSPYWITRGAKHRFGYDGSSGFVELANVVFNDSSNTFVVYSMDEDENETYLGSSGDLSAARSLAMSILESRDVRKRLMLEGIRLK